MPKEALTKNPYVIQFEAQTSCNCSNDCTCEQSVDENTEGWLPNPFTLVKDIVQAPKNGYKTLKNNIKGAGDENAQITAQLWVHQNKIDRKHYNLAFSYIAKYGKEKAKLKLKQGRYYRDKGQRKVHNSESMAELEKEAAHDGTLSRLQRLTHGHTTDQRRAQEVEEAQNRLGRIRQAPVSSTPHGFWPHMPHFNMHPHANLPPRMPHGSMFHMPHLPRVHMPMHVRR